MQKRLGKILVTLTAAGFVGASGAQGEENPSQQQPQYQQPTADPSQPQAAAVSDEELQKFAEAHGQVKEIRDTYTEKTRSADDPGAVAEVQMSMQQEMVEAVQDTGLDVGSYNRIAQMLPYDEELRDRLEGMQ